MAQQKESLQIIASRDQSRKALLFDPRSMSYSGIREIVNLKARSTEKTVIYMEYDDCFVYVDLAKLHEINHLSQQEKRKTIQRITNQIAYSNKALVSSDIIEGDK